VWHNYIEPDKILQLGLRFDLDLVMKTRHLAIYLHIPFCQRICSYCAFNVYAGMNALFDSFVQALVTEIEIVGLLNPNMPICSIFFGGGTPSLLSTQHYAMLFDALQRTFHISNNAEISLESNPNDLNKSYLTDLRQLGFNRISIGMQSAVESELALFGRTHNLKHTQSAVKFARDAGFDNISIDLIFGTPQQTLDDWQLTLKHTIDLQPENISVYNLIFEGGTKLKAEVESGLLSHPDDDLAADMYELATDTLGAAGYMQYEISNWSKPPYESVHNLQYWYNLPYIGLGPGAHGFAGGKRYIVKRHPARYIDSLQDYDLKNLQFPITPAVSKVTLVDRETEISETIMMGLRLTKTGINRQQFFNRFGVDIVDLHRTSIDKFVQYGLLYFDDEHVHLTQQGRFLSNTVIRELI